METQEMTIIEEIVLETGVLENTYWIYYSNEDYANEGDAKFVNLND